MLLSGVAGAIRHLENDGSPGPDGVPAGMIGCADGSGAGVVGAAEQLHWSPISAESCCTSSVRDFVLSLVEGFRRGGLGFAGVVALGAGFPASGMFWRGVRGSAGGSVSASLAVPGPLAASNVVHCGGLCLGWVCRRTL